MDPAEFLAKMRAIDDTCACVDDMHRAADDLMCALLGHLGYGEGVEVFDKMEKWYA